MTSRSSPASLRGAPRERRQGLPETTPRAGQRATRAAHMRSQSGLVGHHTWRPKAPGGLPDAILVPSGFDFVPFGTRFSRPPKTRPGGSRELRGTHFGTILNLCWTLQKPIAASLGPAALPNFGRTWQRRRRNIKRLRVAQGPPRGFQGAWVDSCWEPIAASFGDFPGFVERALGPAVLLNFCTTWQRTHRNI